MAVLAQFRALPGAGLLKRGGKLGKYCVKPCRRGQEAKEECSAGGTAQVMGNRSPHTPAGAGARQPGRALRRTAPVHSAGTRSSSWRCSSSHSHTCTTMPPPGAGSATTSGNPGDRHGAADTGLPAGPKDSPGRLRLHVEVISSGTRPAAASATMETTGRMASDAAPPAVGDAATSVACAASRAKRDALLGPVVGEARGKVRGWRSWV
jgi:hypothetical protein